MTAKVTMPCRKCRYSANQYGAYFTFCDDHWPIVQASCDVLGITPDEMLERAIWQYAFRHVPYWRRVLS